MYCLWFFVYHWLSVFYIILSRYCSITTRLSTSAINHVNKDCCKQTHDYSNNYTITNWRVSLSKIFHEWPNNTVTHECAQCMSELQRYYFYYNNMIFIFKILFTFLLQKFKLLFCLIEMNRWMPKRHTFFSTSCKYFNSRRQK
jgi:hypothetical protein